ncbi:hypothetical protein V1517DRAFT_319884, partial [Lipomyces orientalis]
MYHIGRFAAIYKLWMPFGLCFMIDLMSACPSTQTFKLYRFIVCYTVISFNVLFRCISTLSRHAFVKYVIQPLHTL